MKKKGINNINGFTLIEVLAVIVILGILSTIGIVTITNTRKNQEKKFDQTQYDLFKETAKTYFSDNKYLLPTVPNSTNIVYLEDLIKGNYLDSLLDYDKNSYSLDSYVEIKKIGTNKYFYTVVLRKQGTDEEIKDTSDTDSDKGIEINNYRKDNNTEPVYVENNGKKTYFTNTTVTASVNINDNDGIMAFCYIVYKNNIKIYTSEYITVGNTNDASDTLVLDVNNYGDGTYQVEVVVYDNQDHVRSKKSDIIMIDRVPPTCTTTKTPNLEWTNSKTIVQGTCSDNKGKEKGNSGCQITSTSESEIKDEGIYNISPGVISDKAGNKTTCDEIPVRIDKTKPTCISSGGSEAWTNDSRTLEGKCSDSGSGCRGNTSKVIDKEGSFTNLSPGIVYDNAGNSKECPADQTVKIDRTPPSCSSSGGSTSWTKSNRTLEGKCSDSGSGCKGNISKVIDTEGSFTNLSPGTVYDNAGNSVTCPANQTVKIDKTPPSCSSSGGSTSWTKSSRTLEGKCSDSGSGCRGNISKVIDTEGYFTNVSPGTVYDNAGNSVICPADQTVKIDKTPPSCGTINVSGTKGENDWYTSNVTLTKTNGTDALSGHATTTIDKTSITTETKGTKVTLTTTDNAGNSCTTEKTVKIDKTNPTCGTINVSGTEGFNGWYTSDVTLTKIDGRDTLSEHQSTSLDINKINYDTNGTVVTLTTKDNAGRKCVTTKTIKIDKTKPTCESSGGVNAWANTVLTISGKCSDKTSTCISDVAKIINTDTSNPSLSPGTVYDQAGNSTECPGQPVYRDFTPPDCISSGGSDAWTNDSRTLVGQCSDSGSGCQENASWYINWEGAWTGLSPGIIYDNAENAKECPANQTVKIDKTPPTCISSGGSEAWTNDSRTLFGQCYDSGSGCQGNVSWYINWEGAWTGLSPGTVSDYAGNSITCPYNQTVRIDKTPPTLDISTQWCTAASPCTDNHRLSATATDTLSGVVKIQRKKQIYDNTTGDFTLLLYPDWNWTDYHNRTDGTGCLYSTPLLSVQCISNMVDYPGTVKWSWGAYDAAGNYSYGYRFVYNK